MIAKGQLKLKPRCSNNQAEQFAILKALESIETFNKIIITPSTAIIYTDSRIALDSLQNPKNHAFLVETFRGKRENLQKNNWKIKFSWVKAHAGNYGNETADILAKEAARSQGNKYEYNRIPLCAITKEAAE